MRVTAVLAVLMTCWAGFSSRGSAQPAPIFRFHPDEAWLNLHQFLYVLGRHEAGMGDRTRRAVVDAPADADTGLAGLSADEQQQWREAVRWYAGGHAKQDAVFDTSLIDLAHALVRAGSSSLPAAGGPDPKTTAVLARVGPIYRRAWWSDHQRGNEAWIASIRPLLDAHGGAVLAFITRVYGMSWPSAGYPVHVTAYANWAGAFSTRGNLLLISSRDSGNRDLYALETVFHEAMHQWDDEVDRLLSAEAARQNVRVPPSLSHALIFYTAGEAVRHVAAAHVPYAEANGLWKGKNIGAFKSALDAAWRPYLSGTGRRDSAIADLIKRASR
jgi:hypothetical protein